MAGRPSFALAEGDCYTTFSTNVILLKSESLDLLYRVLAVLNSRLVWAWLSHHAKRRGVGLEINGNVLNKIPIPADIEKTTRETSRLTELAKARVAAEFELRNAKADGIRGLKIAQIESIEAELDKTVYDLFGMTSANIQEIDADTQTQ